ncbi:MAG: hypothetical protein Q9191_000992 [Dirinaria sp. TL-2023a]
MSEDGNPRRDSSTSQDSKSPSDGQRKQTVKVSNSRGCLEVPPQSSFRPSFGSLSDLSSSTVDSHGEIEEYAGRPLVHGGARPPSRAPRPESTLGQRANGAWARNKGLILVILAQFFGALMGVTTRLLETNGAHGRGMHPFQILFARTSITLLFSFMYLYWASVPHAPFGKREVRALLVARGLGGFVGVITFLAPSVACAACWILIKEPFTRSQQVAGLVSLFGIVLIARPTSLLPGISSEQPSVASGSADAVPPPINLTSGAHPVPQDNATPTQRLAAIGLGLIGVFGAACAYTAIRWIGQRAHPLISVTYFSAWCTVVSVVAVLAVPGIDFRLPENLVEWSYLIFLGVSGFLMQFLLTAGLAHEKTSRATNMIYTQILFALAFDKLVFDVTPGSWSIVGSSLVLGSAMYIAVYKETPTVNNQAGESADEELNLMQRENTEPEERQSPYMHGLEEVQLRTMRI